MSSLNRTLCILALVGAAAASRADPITLKPTQDTYVQSINPDTNYGTLPEFWLGRGQFWGLGVIRGYLKFDLSNLPSDPNLVLSATFSAYQYDTQPAAGGLPVDVHRVSADWVETTITYNNQPGFDGQIWASASVGDSFHKTWVTWTVTDLVRAEVASGVHNGWLFKANYEGTAGASRLGYFRSREFSEQDFRPKLVIELGFQKGDLDCDGNVNFGDINPFVLALGGREGYEKQYPNCNWLNGDCNNDGDVNFGDINPFVELLGGE